MDKKIFKPQIGDPVRVKKAVMCPEEEDICLEGWQGRVIDLSKDGDKDLIGIRWDSITLKNIPSDYIDRSEEEDLDYSIMYLWLEEIESAEYRDSEEDVQRILGEINHGKKWFWAGDKGKRIQKILAGVDDGNTMDEFKAWYDYLKQNLKFPFTAVVSEYQEKGPFRCGEKVVVKAIELIDDFYGVIANLKKGDIPLCDLEATDSNSPNYQPVHDYRFWFANR